MEPRIIKNDEQYQAFQAEVTKLVALDPEPDSAKGIRLELLAKLVEDYEKERFAFEKPDPIDAILFRMEQQGLRQKDIAEVLGGRNRASEVLARKRPLTLSMIRGLNDKLDIPAGLLIREPRADYGEPDLGLDGKLDDALARTLIVGGSSLTSKRRIAVWLARVRENIKSGLAMSVRFQPDALNEESLRYLAHLSWMERGPQLAREFLAELGVALVIEPAPEGSSVDGAALLSDSGAPVIALTLRMDRLDSFWYQLIQLCVHARKHLDALGLRAIVHETMESPPEKPTRLESEAAEVASELLVPTKAWRNSGASREPTVANIKALATKLQVSPAIVAGRIRRERQDYSLFKALVGHRQARDAFPEVKWGK